GRVQKVVPHLPASEVVYSIPDGLFSLVTGDHPTLTGILFREWVIAEHLPFDPAVAFCDLDLYVRIAARHAFVACAQPCGIFVDHGGSFTHGLAVGDLWR